MDTTNTPPAEAEIIPPDPKVVKGSLQDLLDRQGFLTINALVKYLKQYHPDKAVTYPTIQRWTERGILQYYKYGGQYRVKKESIDKLVKYGTDLQPERLHPELEFTPTEATKATTEDVPQRTVEQIRQDVEAEDARIAASQPYKDPETSFESLYGISGDEQSQLKAKLNNEPDPTLPIDEDPDDN